MKSLLFTLLLGIAPLFIDAQDIILETERLVIKTNIHGETLLHLNDPTGTYNTFLGHNAGQLSKGTLFRDVFANTFVGHDSGIKMVNGGGNTFIGAGSGQENENGLFNSIFGAFGGFSMTSGSKNTFLGYLSGGNKTSGNNNTFIGRSSGENNGDGSSNIFIGFEAGKNAIGSDKLYISNSNTDSPLIYGEFDNDLFRINGTLEIEQLKTYGVLEDKIYANSVPLAYGYISLGGAISTGYGIKQSGQIELGKYEILLDRAFTKNPVVLVTPYSATRGVGLTATYYAEFTDNKIFVHIINEAGEPIYAPFSLMVMGW